MAITVGEPIQIPSSETSSVVITQSGQHHDVLPTHTHTLVLKKLTPSGTNGSITLVGGTVTAYTKPT